MEGRERPVHGGGVVVIVTGDFVLSVRQVADIMGISAKAVLQIEEAAFVKICVGCLRDPELRGLMVACLDLEDEKESTDESEQGDADWPVDERPGDRGRGQHVEDRILFGDQQEMDDEGW
jgi:hypothetical protein